MELAEKRRRIEQEYDEWTRERLIAWKEDKIAHNSKKNNDRMGQRQRRCSKAAR